MNKEQKKLLKTYLIAFGVIVIISFVLIGVIMLGYAQGGSFIWD